MIDESITVLPVETAPTASAAEWNVIHSGKEFGPLSLAKLVDKATVGEVEADDLVKQSGGLWAKARDFEFLRQKFLLRNSDERASQGTLNQLDRFHGFWVSKKVLMIVGCVLTVLVALVWVISKPTNSYPHIPELTPARTDHPSIIELADGTWQSPYDGPYPDVRMYRKSDASGIIRGTVHNESGRTVVELMLSIKTPEWKRVYTVRVRILNNTTGSWSVYVADTFVEVQSFTVLAISRE